MRAFFPVALMALLIGVPVAGAAAHDGWFVRVCPAKTEAGRIHLTFSGGRQGYSWSWIKGRTSDEIDLPRRFRSVARLTIARQHELNPEQHREPHDAGWH
jgi:hypothetical protein